MATSGSVVRVHRRNKKSAPPNLHLKPSGARQTFSTSKRQREYMQQLQIDGLYCVLTVQNCPKPPENPIAKTISPPSPEGSESECSEFSESSSQSDEADSDDSEQVKPKKKKKEKKKVTPKSTKKVLNEKSTSVFVCMRNTMTSFGRSSENNGLVLPDPFVSQKHFQISEEGGVFYVSDQASMNGTFLRKKCDFTREGRALSANMIFVLGQTAFTVAALRDKSTVTDEKESVSDPNLTLRFKHKTGYIDKDKEKPELRYRHITLSMPITSKGCLLGRGEDCGIRLVDDAVDVHQAEIFFRDGRFYIRNFNPETIHGFWTRLSAAAQQSALIPLSDGDVIKVGASELLVELRSRPPQPKILFPKKAPTCAIDIGTAVDGNWINQKEMQDRLIVIDGYGGVPTNGFFAVFDGHQERRVADFATAALHQNLLVEIELAKQNKAYTVRGRPSSPVTFISSTPPASPPSSPTKPSPSRFGQLEPDFMFDRSITPESLASPSFVETPQEEKKKISDSTPSPLPRRRINVPRFQSAQDSLYSHSEEREYESLSQLFPKSSSLVSSSSSERLDTSSLREREPKHESEEDTHKGSSLIHDDVFRSLESPFHPGTRSMKTISSTVSSIASTVSTLSTGSTSSSESVQGCDGGISIPDCIRNAFDRTAKQMEGLGDISKYGGSTALVCLLWKDEKTNQTKLYTANLGDTRAVLCRNGGPVTLSYDHVARDPSEQARVKSRGGVIQNNMLGFCLEVSRAFGDFGLVPLGMSHEPTISEAILTPKDEFVVLASDGLWNVMSNHAVMEFVKKTWEDKSKPISCDDVARTLLNKALKKPECNDNLSCVVIRLSNDETSKGVGVPIPEEETVESAKLTITLPPRPPPSEQDCLVPVPPPSPSLSPLPIQSIQLSPPSPCLHSDPSPVSSKKADSSSKRRVRTKTSPPTLELNPSKPNSLQLSQSVSALAAVVVDSEIETDLDVEEGGEPSPPTPHGMVSGSEHWGALLGDKLLLGSESPQISKLDTATAKVASPSCYLESISPSLDSIFSPPSPSDSTPISGVHEVSSSTSSASS